jgi:hypothetical protein
MKEGIFCGLQTLLDVFRNPCVKKFPTPSLVASVLPAIGFDAAGVPAFLAKVGFEVAGELLPSLPEVSEKDISALGDRLEKKIAGTPELNEAAARTVAEQVTHVAETVAQTHSDDKSEIAEALGQVLASDGVITPIDEQH